MNYARIALAAGAATFAFYIYGFLVNGLLIAKDYRPYTGVYRAADAVMSRMPLGFASIFIATLALAMIYARGYSGAGGLAQGACFGVLVGIFVACAFEASNYVTMNIGGKLAQELAAASLIQWTIVGSVIGLAYKPAVAAVH